MPRRTRDTKSPPVQGRTQTAPVLLRLEPDHLTLIDKAAAHMGLGRSSWMRSTLLQAARGTLREETRRELHP